MKNKNYRIIFLAVAMFLMLLITSCSCGKVRNRNLYQEDENKDGIKNVIEWVNKKLNSADETRTLQQKKDDAINLIKSYALEDGITNGKKKYQYRYDIIANSEIAHYTDIINSSLVNEAKDTDTSDDSKWVKAASYVQNCTTASNKEASEVINQIDQSYEDKQNLNLNDVVCAFVLKTDEIYTSPEPIHFYTGKEFWSHLFNNLLVFPIAWIIFQLSHFLGGFYIIGLFITTILVRTIAWPIYAKTNDMSLKMQLMQPELTKIQEKYGNRQDERSKQMQQMEMAQLYKKYKIGLSGCLMPLLQFPIFMAVYQAVSRIPYTKAYANTIFKNDWANILNPRFLGINLFLDREGGTGQLIGIIVLMIIVVGTQFLSQWLAQRRQKKSQQQAQDDIPLYRRQAYNQEKNSSQSSMKIMMYVMMLMMGLFVFTSKAGLGVYWCIGNLYSMAQMYINSKTSAKRLEKLKKKI